MFLPSHLTSAPAPAPTNKVPAPAPQHYFPPLKILLQFPSLQNTASLAFISATLSLFILLVKSPIYPNSAPTLKYRSPKSHCGGNVQFSNYWQDCYWGTVATGKIYVLFLTAKNRRLYLYHLCCYFFLLLFSENSDVGHCFVSWLRVFSQKKLTWAELVF